MNHIILALIDQKITEVAQSFQAQAGGASLCQLQKDGRVTGGVKYDEGQLVALRAAHRALSEQAPEHGEEGQPAVSAIETIATVQKTWLNRLAAQQAKERPAAAWIAYYQGGSDALAWLVEILETATGSAAG